MVCPQVLDELGRGTSTFDGYAIAYAVLRHLSREASSPHFIVLGTGLCFIYSFLCAYTLARMRWDSLVFCFCVECSLSSCLLCGTWRVYWGMSCTADTKACRPSRSGLPA